MVRCAQGAVGSAVSMINGGCFFVLRFIIPYFGALFNKKYRSVQQDAGFLIGFFVRIVLIPVFDDGRGDLRGGSTAACQLNHGGHGDLRIVIGAKVIRKPLFFFTPLTITCDVPVLAATSVRSWLKISEGAPCVATRRIPLFTAVRVDLCRSRLSSILGWVSVTVPLLLSIRLCTRCSW